MEKYTEPFSPVYQDNILFFFFFLVLCHCCCNLLLGFAWCILFCFSFERIILKNESITCYHTFLKKQLI